MSNNLTSAGAQPLAEQIAEILNNAGPESIVDVLEYCEYFAFFERNFLNEPNERNISIKKGSAIILAIGNAWFKTVAKA